MYTEHLNEIVEHVLNHIQDKQLDNDIIIFERNTIDEDVKKRLVDFGIDNILQIIKIKKMNIEKTLNGFGINNILQIIKNEELKEGLFQLSFLNVGDNYELYYYIMNSLLNTIKDELNNLLKDFDLKEDKEKIKRILINEVSLKYSFK